MMKEGIRELLCVYMYGVVFNIIVAIEVFIKSIWDIHTKSDINFVGWNKFLKERVPIALWFIVTGWFFWVSNPYSISDLE